LSQNLLGRNAGYLRLKVMKWRVFCIVCTFIFSGAASAASGGSLSFTFTNLNIPGGGNALGINDRGQIVGNSLATSPSTAFVETGGSFSSISFPGSQYTGPTGISDSGQIVGTYYDGTNQSFLETNGAFATLSYPGAFQTIASGINNLGQVVGYYNNQSAGFLYSNGTFRAIAVPGATQTSASGINDSGQVVGQYVDSQGVSHGFIDNNGTFTTIDVPGALGTGVAGINNQGQMVGSYSCGNGCSRGFVDTLGVITTGIDYPGAHDTYLFGINDSGEIVGYALTADFTELGFISTSPAIPQINSGGVVNAANYIAPVVSGSIASAFGTYPVNPFAVAPSVPLPDSLLGLSLQAGSVAQAPLFFASNAQVNFQVPWELAGQTTTTVAASVSGQTGAAEAVTLAPYAPGIFTIGASGGGAGAILDSSYSLVDASNPAIPGVTYILIYCTGLGAVSANQPATGAAASLTGLAPTVTPVTVTIGGVTKNAAFSGLAPGYVGLYQVNVQVPAGSATGPAVPVVISIGGVESNAVTVAVQ
jgi:uncharacterized protein (TIGR03437 family)